ncbi:MAG: DUF433 domain-containing protein [Chloroflexi bacterium]|nr:DUF433 domain-containing protein [Chloroflexota bacterium]
MQLEDYFDFLAPNDIRLKGSRIGIESVLYEYIHRGQAPEAIDVRFPSLSLEQIYATILYYLHNKEEVHQYMTEWIEFGERMREEQERNPPPLIQKLRRIKAGRHKEITEDEFEFDNSDFQDQIIYLG